MREGQGLTWAQVEAIALTFMAFIGVHFAHSAIWTAGALPRTRMHTASYVGCWSHLGVSLRALVSGGFGLMEEKEPSGDRGEEYG